MSKYKMIFNRNKKQLENIIERKIQEKHQYSKECIERNDMRGMEIQDGKISILRWVLEVLDNPKKWEHGGSICGYGIDDKILNDDEIFREDK